MIRFNDSHDKLQVDIAIDSRIAVYLDNFALIQISKSPVHRRNEFLHAIQRAGTLLFSWTNWAEISGPTGASAAAIGSLLESVGPYWAPVEMNPWKVIERETAGQSSNAVFSSTLVQAYLEEQFDRTRTSQILEKFVNLRRMLDWAQVHRDNLLSDSRQLDQCLREEVRKAREKYDSGLAMLEYLDVPFKAHQPANYYCNQLIRLLVRESKAFQFKQGDAMDFCHAVIAASYASIATLDTQWKRRVSLIPIERNGVRLYAPNEIDRLIDEFTFLSYQVSAMKR